MNSVQTQAGSGDITPAAADGSISLATISGRAAAVAEPPEQCHKPAEACRNEKMQRHHWTPDQITILRDLYPTVRAKEIAERIGCSIRSILYKADALGLRKTPETIAAMAADAMRDPMHPGRAFLIPSGNIPWNKGISFTAGGRSAETRFKKGQAPLGNAAINVKPLGFERISKGGYLERKFNNDKPFKNRWRAVHLLLWEAEHGPLPAGHAVIFINGDKRDIRLDNLRLVTRAELMRMNMYHRYGKEIARAIQLRGAIIRKINAIQRKEKTA